MRISVDVDSRNPLLFLFVLLKGIFLCRKLPRYLRKTTRGYHLVWYGLPFDENKQYVYRRWIGDDANRIRLDKERKKAFKQVLFSEKKVWAIDGGKKTLIQG